MVISGCFLTAVGALLITIGVVTALVTAVKHFAEARDPDQGGGIGKGIISDTSKLVESLSKAPLWLATIFAGDVQIWLGMSLWSGKLPFVS